MVVTDIDREGDFLFMRKFCSVKISAFISNAESVAIICEREIRYLKRKAK